MNTWSNLDAGIRILKSKKQLPSKTHDFFHCNNKITSYLPGVSTAVEILTRSLQIDSENLAA